MKKHLLSKYMLNFFETIGWVALAFFIFVIAWEIGLDKMYEQTQNSITYKVHR